MLQSPCNWGFYKPQHSTEDAKTSQTTPQLTPFVMPLATHQRNLHHIRIGRDFNTLGELEAWPKEAALDTATATSSER